VTEEGRRTRNKTPAEISDFGPALFNVMDRFDMFRPYFDGQVTDEEHQLIVEETYGKKYTRCEAKFAPGNYELDLYFSFISARDVIFLRNYTTKTTERQI
jgi:hypothetical protein